MVYDIFCIIMFKTLAPFLDKQPLLLSSCGNYFLPNLCWHLFSALVLLNNSCLGKNTWFEAIILLNFCLDKLKIYKAINFVYIDHHVRFRYFLSINLQLISKCLVIFNCSLSSWIMCYSFTFGLKFPSLLLFDREYILKNILNMLCPIFCSKNKNSQMC